MKNTKLLTVTAMGVLCMCLAVAGIAQQGTGGPGGPPPPSGGIPPPPPADRVDGITQGLGLTSDQATALTAILTTTDATMKPLMEAVGDATKALRDAFKAADFTTAATLTMAKADAELAATNASIVAWAQIKASGILTTDQFAELLAGPKPGGPPQSGSNSGSGSGSSAKGRR